MIPLTHQPVLLKESIEALSILPHGVYVDGTFGRGSHSKAILERLNDQGRLLVIDRDPEAIQYAKTLLGSDARCFIQPGSFADLAVFVQRMQGDKKVNGILLDLGVSSPQLETAHRGFSFLIEGPLDMRMDPHQDKTAREWLQTVSEKELVKVLQQYGEERYARRIARAILQARTHKEAFKTTTQLAELIKKAVPTRERNKHPATRTFLAIRIFINRELEELQKGLEASLQVLAPEGRLVVISFHSLEDRIVKQFMKRQAVYENKVPGMPVVHPDWTPTLKRIGRAIKPSLEETQKNPRARSAILRIAERINES